MTAERPSYVDKKTGLSSEYAKKAAERFEKMDALKSIVDSSLPRKESLSWKDSANPYVVQDSDKKGLLEILKNNIPEAKLGDLNYARIAYYNCFNQVEGLKTNSGTDRTKLWDINVMETGDKIFVQNGKVFIIRKDGSDYASFGVDLYPWSSAATESAPTTPAAPAPAPVEPAPVAPTPAPSTTPPAAPTTPPPETPTTPTPAPAEPAAPLTAESPEALAEAPKQVTLNGETFYEGNPTNKQNLPTGIYVWQESDQNKLTYVERDGLTPLTVFTRNGAYWNWEYDRGDEKHLAQVKDGHIVFAGQVEGENLRGEKRITGKNETGVFAKTGDHALLNGTRIYNNGTIEEGVFAPEGNNRLTAGSKTTADGKIEKGEFDEMGHLKILSTPEEGITLNDGKTFYGKYSSDYEKSVEHIFYNDGYLTWNSQGTTHMEIWREGKLLSVPLKGDGTGVYTWHEPTDPEGVRRRVILSDGKMKAYGIIQPDGKTWMGYKLENGAKVPGKFNLLDDESVTKP